MRLHHITALLLVGPFAISAARLAAQDTTQAQKQGQQRDSSYQQNPQANMNMQSQDQAQLSDEQVVMKMHHINQMEIRTARLAQSRASSARVKSLASRLIRDHTASDKKVVALAKQLDITLRGDGMDSTGSQYGRGHMRDRYNKPDSTQRNDSTYSSYPRSYSDTTQQQSDTARRYGERFDSTQGQGRYGQGRYGQDQDSTRDAMRQLQTLRGAAFDTAFANAMVTGHNKAINLFETAQNSVQRPEVRTLIANTLPTLRQHLQLAQSLTTGATTTSSRQ